MSKELPVSDHAFGDYCTTCTRNKDADDGNKERHAAAAAATRNNTNDTREPPPAMAGRRAVLYPLPSLPPVLFRRFTFHFFYYETRYNDGAEGHTSVVGDVVWHQQNPKLLGSVGDDRQLIFWDTSMDGSKPTTVIKDVRRRNVLEIKHDNWGVSGGGVYACMACRWYEAPVPQI